VLTGKDDHTQPGLTTSREQARGGEGHRTEINGECTFMVWPMLGSRTDKEQNRLELFHMGCFVTVTVTKVFILRFLLNDRKCIT